MSDSPKYSSAEIAVALLEAARHQSNVVSDAEILFSAMPISPGLTDTLRRMRAKAEMLGEAHRHFKRLAEEEQAENLAEAEKRLRWLPKVAAI